MKDILMNDKIEVSAIQLIVWLDKFMEKVLEEAEENGGDVDTTVVARNFVVEKFRERMGKGDEQ